MRSVRGPCLRGTGAGYLHAHEPVPPPCSRLAVCSGGGVAVASLVWRVLPCGRYAVHAFVALAPATSMHTSLLRPPVAGWPCAPAVESRSRALSGEFCH